MTWERKKWHRQFFVAICCVRVLLIRRSSLTIVGCFIFFYYFLKYYFSSYFAYSLLLLLLIFVLVVIVATASTLSSSSSSWLYAVFLSACVHLALSVVCVSRSLHRLCGPHHQNEATLYSFVALLRLQIFRRGGFFRLIQFLAFENKQHS